MLVRSRLFTLVKIPPIPTSDITGDLILAHAVRLIWMDFTINDVNKTTKGTRLSSVPLVCSVRVAGKLEPISDDFGERRSHTLGTSAS